MVTARLSPERLALAYRTARLLVLSKGYGPEIDWQASRSLDSLTESDFLREAAWVVLTSGMSEAVVRARFRGVTNAFLEWTSAAAIARDVEACKQRALKFFAHRRKTDAIGEIAVRTFNQGFTRIVDSIRKSGVEYIRSFPYMGPITSLHLGKSIGLPVVKPDRHLVRAASAAGYATPKRLCEEIASLTGDRLAVVDIILWRYGTLLSGDYDGLFGPDPRSQLSGCLASPSGSWPQR